MSIARRLAGIGFLAPALAFVLVTIVWSSVFLAVAVVGYPIMVLVTLVCVFPLHRLFVARAIPIFGQLPIVLGIALLGGLFVHVTLFFDSIFLRGVFSARLAGEYCFLGLVAGTFAWLLYNFGPLRIAQLAP